MLDISEIIKMILIIAIYIFIIIIFKHIYLDVKAMDNSRYDRYPYIKLLHRKDGFPFKIEEVYNIYKDTKIGSDIHNDVVIKSPELEKFHTEIKIDKGKYFVVPIDNNSIIVNEVVIKEKHEINDKDIIKIGNISFIFMRGLGG